MTLDITLNIHQLDAITAFLQGDLTEVIYLVQSKRFTISNEVCKLKKSLYGLKQTSRIQNFEVDGSP